MSIPPADTPGNVPVNLQCTAQRNMARNDMAQSDMAQSNMASNDSIPNGSAPHDMPEKKARLRRLVMARRMAASQAYGQDAAHSLAQYGRDLFAGLAPGTVSAFWPTRGEPDVRPLMHALHESGRTIGLPVMAGPEDPLTFRAWQPGDELVRGPFRIMEPAPTQPIVAPTILLVPLVAFDREGYRLGYGGGYYDRTLAKLAAEAGGKAPIAYGVAYRAQEVVHVPSEAHDIPLHGYLTPEGVRTSHGDVAPDGGPGDREKGKGKGKA